MCRAVLPSQNFWIKCGNKIVEEGEECDCGFDEAECAEQCCHPRTFGSSADTTQVNDKSCKLKPGKECSPSIGPCCDGQCRFIKASHQQMCRPEQDCTELAYCDGKSAKCPEPEHKVDNDTECNEGTQVCQQGDCKGSICLKYGLEQVSFTHLQPSKYIYHNNCINCET